MFGYCTSELGMSRDEAYCRIAVARTAREYPELYDYLADGRLNLTAVRRLMPHVTRDNARSLFEAASNKTVEAVERMVAERFPRADVATTLRKLPSPSPRPSPRPSPSPSPSPSPRPGPRSGGGPNVSSADIQAPSSTCAGPNVGKTDVSSE